MVNKVRVYGKAQNRTALGIIHAYHVMYPHATLEDLNKAFPKSLNPETACKDLFLPVAEVNELIKSGKAWMANGQGYFLEDDTFLIMPDKTPVAVVSMWPKASFERIVEHAKQYGIEIAEFEKAMKGEKGGFRLEYLNGYVPPMPKEKKTPKWLWAIIGLVLLVVVLLIIFFMNRG